MTPAPERTPSRVPPLSRATVAEAALRLLNETGLEKLTLRAIATELHVKAPALYWHFKSKQELIDEMATEMFRRMVRGRRAPRTTRRPRDPPAPRRPPRGANSS
jgi:AcrR family transcriptional regulator